MLELALGLCALVFMLFLCIMASLFLKRTKMKMFIGFTMSFAAALAMALFCYIQRVNGNPDQGMELLQWYLPLTAFIFFIIAGIVAAASAIEGKSKREAGGNYGS